MSQLHPSSFARRGPSLGFRFLRPRYNKHYFKRLAKSLDESEPLILKRGKDNPLLTSENLKTLLKGSKELLRVKDRSEKEKVCDGHDSEKLIALNTKLDDLEKVLMPIALAIPNRWSRDLPDHDLVVDHIDSKFLSKQNLFKTLSHTKLSYINNCYSKSVVGPNSHYYYGIGAKLQHGLSEYFMDRLEENSFIPVSGLSLSKSIIVEACNTRDMKDWAKDPSQVITVQEQQFPVHLTEASRESLVAFLATLNHRNTNDPLKLVTNGAGYCQGSDWFDSDTNKISQYQTVHAIVQSPSIEAYSREHYTEFRDFLWKSYKNLELPVRLVHCCLDSMYMSEFDAYRIDVWLPSRQNWIQASRISNYVDFITVRSGMKRGHIMDSPVFDGRAVVAAIIENRQTSTGKFNIPTILQTSMPHLSREELANYFASSASGNQGHLLSSKSTMNFANFDQRRYLAKRSHGYAFFHAKKVYKKHNFGNDLVITLCTVLVVCALIDWTELWRSKIPRSMQRVLYDYIYRPSMRLWWTFLHRDFNKWPHADLPFDQIDKSWYEKKRGQIQKDMLFENQPQRSRDYTKSTEKSE